MIKTLHHLLLATLFLLPLHAGAIVNVYKFDDPNKKERFYNLIDELRCTVCQNQTIGDSNSDLAKDLRDKVYNMVQAGKTDQEIKDYMVERFTDFVLYNPPVKSNTYLLWIGPFVILAIGVIFMLVNIKRRQGVAEDVALDEQQQQRIQAILRDNDKDS